jgi:hypothetical protein
VKKSLSVTPATLDLELIYELIDNRPQVVEVIEEPELTTSVVLKHIG